MLWIYAVAAEPPTGEPPTGEPPTGEPPTGEPPTGESPTGPGGPPTGALGSGLAGEPLRALRYGSLVAVAGELAAPPAMDREALLGHERTVRRLAAGSGALLPVRFGEAVADRAALAARLTLQAKRLEEALELVAGCVQMTLRVYGAPEPEPAAGAGAGEAAAVGAGGPGSRYLEARRRAAERARSLPEIASLRRRLRPLVRCERVRRHGAGTLLASVYDLVERSRMPDYLALLEATGGEASGRRLRWSGPWPPWAFAPEAP